MKYHARFTGCLKGAIGIHYPIEAFTEGDSPKAAELALYDTYDHISGARLTPLVWRYVASYQREGYRFMCGAVQGRNTYATPAEAQDWIDAVLTNTAADTIRSIWGPNPDLQVAGVWCWPVHFDPIGGFAPLQVDEVMK